MALKDTVTHMKYLIDEMNRDIDKAMGGNKAASQRCRTNSIKFAKCAKLFRKESLMSEKKSGSKKTAKKSPIKKKAKYKKR